MDSLRHSEGAIIKESNIARKAIMDAVKAGTMTKDSARKAMMDLNKTTREALKANPVLAWAKLALKDCETEMLTAIRVYLTDEQKVKFDKWVRQKRLNRF